MFNHPGRFPVCLPVPGRCFTCLPSGSGSKASAASRRRASVGRLEEGGGQGVRQPRLPVQTRLWSETEAMVAEVRETHRYAGKESLLVFAWRREKITLYIYIHIYILICVYIYILMCIYINMYIHAYNMMSMK